MTQNETTLLKEMTDEIRATVQAAAYAIYFELTPDNKKPLSPREFHLRYRDNWEFYMNTIQQEYDEEVEVKNK